MHLINIKNPRYKRYEKPKAKISAKALSSISIIVKSPPIRLKNEENAKIPPMI